MFSNQGTRICPKCQTQRCNFNEKKLICNALSSVSYHFKMLESSKLLLDSLFKYLYECFKRQKLFIINSRKFKIIYLHTCTVQNSKIVNIDKIFAPQSQIKCVAEASSPDFDLLVMAKTRSAVLGDLVMYSLGRFLCRPGTQRR